MTWGELIRKLKAAGYLEVRGGKGSHQLGNRILREAGIL